ncbi:MAG: nucleotidyl transferase AbiEii/AbiGii toxin family protein [Opitutaceae bacterium]
MWPLLAEIPRHFVLYGGTAVALRLGHRVSVDFDFFSAEPFRPDAILTAVSWLRTGELRFFQRQNNTLTVEAGGPAGAVKLSFFGGLGIGQVCAPDICPDNGLKVASAEDLLALKLATIQQREEAKDFFDIHALLRAGLPLEQALGHLEAIHPIGTNAIITLKALVYFKGGDLEALPDDLKRDLEAAVRRAREVIPYRGITKPIGTM